MFAIAITLLIIEIGVPHVVGTESLFEKLVELWPSYLGYAISFLVIGTVWANRKDQEAHAAHGGDQFEAEPEGPEIFAIFFSPGRPRRG